MAKRLSWIHKVRISPSLFTAAAYFEVDMSTKFHERADHAVDNHVIANFGEQQVSGKKYSRGSRQILAWFNRRVIVQPIASLT
jgi:hypothetical protein